jgi:hypothetical protein
MAEPVLEKAADVLLGHPHRCTECGRSFGTEHGLIVHRHRVHRRVVKPLTEDERQRQEALERRRAKDRAYYHRQKAKKQAAKKPAAKKPATDKGPPAPSPEPAGPPPVLLNYCPHCGGDLLIIQHALAIDAAAREVDRG